VTPRVLVTRASAQAGSLAAALEAQGLRPILVPAIVVELDPPGGDLDREVRHIPTFDWVVVTSPNGARAIVAAARRVRTSLSASRWAAIGDGTAEILEGAGVEVDVQPSRAEARVLADELPVARGEQILVVRGDLADHDLPTRLVARGGRVTDVVAYRTLEGPPTSRLLLRNAFAPGDPDAVVLASGSAARGLVSLARAEALELGPIPVICIGPETDHEAVRLGFHVVAISPKPDVSALAATTAAAVHATTTAAAFLEPLETR
jgi:uroporphyrinogen-III synthase